MSAIAFARDGLLLVGVVAGWLGAAGLVRLATPYQRIHCVAFVTVVGGFCFCAAVFVTHPLSPLGWKALLILVTLLCAGAVVGHATGRALFVRERGREEG
ncbi:MAG TPA: monovalent cation/H(+) antiporter subunit G [Stellaceae bacterium]|nr:monovalent cation/H(+) antiporter subunit G [Stellaceae bacterium]